MRSSARFSDRTTATIRIAFMSERVGGAGTL
jgi:hypothetical protein